jgi:2,3-bisphosphoglycerate-dependent phosphoglycerate mutase
MVLMMNYFDASYGFVFWQTLKMPDIFMLSFEEDKLIDVKRIW